MTVTMKSPAKPEALPNLGQNFRYLRWLRGLNLSEISTASGIPQSTLSKVENGQMSLNFDKLVKLAKALDVRVERLFTVEGAKNGQSSAPGRRTVDRWAEPD